MSDKPSIESNNPLPHPTQTPIQNKNYVSPYSMFYSSNVNRPSYPEYNQLAPQVNTHQPQPSPAHFIQTQHPVTEQVTYPNYNVPPTSILPPQQNITAYNPQGNHYPSPYQQVNPYAMNTAESNLSQRNMFEKNNLKKERMMLKTKYKKLCTDHPNLMNSEDRLKLKTTMFFQSLVNVSYFIYFIFKFNSVYLQTLTNSEKMKKTFKFFGIYMLINLPFMSYEDSIINKSFNNKFHGLSEPEIRTMLNDLDKSSLKII